MNSKYFGNSLDLFKFDLLTYLAKVDSLNIYYIGMITSPQPKELDLKYTTYEVGNKNKTLREFLQSQFTRDENKVISLMKDYYQKISIGFNDAPQNGYFKDETREEYFERAINNYTSTKSRSLVFFDPDIGSDIGVSRRFRSNKDMYVRGAEVKRIMEVIKSGDYIGFFQHLGNNNYSIANRLHDVRESLSPYALLIAYQRIQAAIVLVFNNEDELNDKKGKIREYINSYDHLKHKDKLILV